MQKLLFLAPLLLLLAGCGESTPAQTTKTQADGPKRNGASPDASKPEVETPPAMMRVEYYEISKK